MKITGKPMLLIGMSLIIALGVIHLYNAPAEYQEAHYVGLLFMGHCLGSFVAAAGIYRGSRSWGWGLGFILSVSACLGYILSRTVGLPGMEPETWLNPTGILSLIIEVAFIIQVVYIWTRPAAQKG